MLFTFNKCSLHFGSLVTKKKYSSWVRWVQILGRERNDYLRWSAGRGTTAAGWGCSIPFQGGDCDGPYISYGSGGSPDYDGDADGTVIVALTSWRAGVSAGIVGGQLARRGFYNDADRCSGKFMRMCAPKKSEKSASGIERERERER